MPRVNPIQTAVNAGEFSPRMAARVDFSKYPNGAARLENMLPLPQGGLARRPGTRFVVETKNSAKAARLGRFQFSTQQAYILELGEQYIRFCRNQGQIVAETVSAAITNGTFDTNTTGWTDDSNGTGSIGQRILEDTVFGTWDATVNLTASNSGTGDVGSSRMHGVSTGFRFAPSVSGEINEVRINVRTTNGGFDAQCGIYTDSGGSPGTLVGSNSAVVEIGTPIVGGEKAFTWVGAGPSLTSGTNYWIVITDISLLGYFARCDVVNDQGAAFITANHDTLASIANGSGTWNAGFDLRIRITMVPIPSNGLMDLRGAGAGNEAIATQSIAITEADTDHSLRFRVIGSQNDRVIVRIGTVAGGFDVLAERELAPGWHVIPFQTGAATAFLQFQNNLAKTISIDDVAIIDNAAVEMGSPYLESELDSLKFAQSADVLYVAHPNHPVMKIERRGHADWALVEVDWQDGPYLDANLDSDKKLTFDSSTGLGVTCTATGHAPFGPGDVGRLIRSTANPNSTEWGWAVIVAYESPTVVTVDIIRDVASGAHADWILGAWSTKTGFPTTIGFHEQRLAVAGSTEQPQTFWLSQSADIENMRPDSFQSGANETQDDDALAFTIAADEVNRILWLSSGSRLVVGTSGGEWTVTSQGPVITPSDIDVKRQTTHGSADTAPVRVSDVVLFLQRAMRKIREFVFRFETDNFQAPDLTLLSDHITRSGIKEMVWQQEPDSVIWCRRSDGGLVSLTYKREQDVVGWSRQILGGAFAGGSPVVEAIQTIPGNDQVSPSSENRDEVWLIVRRTIGGVTKRHVEVMAGLFEGPSREEFETDAAFMAALQSDQKGATYIDSSLAYDGAPATTISGLDHLEGETVKVWADGATQADKTVTGGQISIASASKVQVGLGFRHLFKSLKLDAGAAAGTAVGKKKRIHAITFVVLHALKLKQGPALEDLLERDLAVDGDPPALFSGEVLVPFDGDWEADARIVVAGDDPAPFYLLAIAPELKTNDGA